MYKTSIHYHRNKLQPQGQIQSFRQLSVLPKKHHIRILTQKPKCILQENNSSHFRRLHNFLQEQNMHTILDNFLSLIISQNKQVIGMRLIRHLGSMGEKLI
jgi:hypothetical protein